MGVWMAVAITGKDKTVQDGRAVSARCKDAKAARRMLAIAMVLQSHDRKTAVRTCGMDRQTLLDQGEGHLEFCLGDRIQP